MQLTRYPFNPPPADYIQAFAMFAGKRPSIDAPPQYLLVRDDKGLWSVLRDIGGSSGAVVWQQAPGTYLSANFATARGRLRDFLSEGKGGDEPKR